MRLKFKGNEVTRKALGLLRDYSGAVGLGLLAVVMAMAGGVTYLGSREKLDELESSQRKLGEVNRRIAALEALENGELVGMKPVVEEALPTEKPVFVALEKLANLAVESGVVIADLSSNPGSLASASARVEPRGTGGRGSAAETARGRRAAQTFDQVAVKVRVEGPFDSMSNFLLDLDKLLPLIDLSEVRILPRTRGLEGGSDFLGELELLVYWMPRQEIDLGGNIQEANITAEQREAFDRIAGSAEN